MKKLIIFVVALPVVCFVALRIAALLTAQGSIAVFTTTAGPLAVVGIIATALALTSYVLSLVTRDFSWVDRMWSTVPVLYAWIYASASSYDPRTTIVAALVSIWGARLTFNFARRGGYTSTEDYRWEVLKRRITNPVVWQLFSLLFISTYQNLLFVLFTLPVYVLYLTPGASAGPAFWAAAVAFVLFLVYETAADQQQWQFQNAKAGRPGHGDNKGHREDMQRGFRTTGLFGLSRHPNYFGELMIWWTIYALGATAVGTVIHASGIGALLLTALFIGSTAFTESISAKRYPEYASYQATTSAIVPWPRRRVGLEEAPEEPGAG